MTVGERPWSGLSFGTDQLTVLCCVSPPPGNMVKVLRGHQNRVYSSAFSPDSSVLCSVGAGKAVR